MRRGKKEQYTVTASTDTVLYELTDDCFPKVILRNTTRSGGAKVRERHIKRYTFRDTH